ncbi:MAG: MFS transporter [Betaproteobacteria bacterium]|nr:MFS transporter [Betaproteobacteria bacterium]
MTAESRRLFWGLTLSAAGVMMVTMGIRQSLGLWVSPLNTATGLGIVTVSFALAVGQFVWGASQPLFGMLADRVGSFAVLVLGGLLLAIGLAATTFMETGTGLVVFLGLITAAGAGAGSFSILLAAAAQRLTPERRAFGSGFINAGGSFGQFLFAPLSQFLISTIGWMAALWAMAVAALATIPMSLPLREKKGVAEARAAAQSGGVTLGQQMKQAFGDRSYICLHLGFFTCGFHIAFLVTHLPGEVGLCGLPASVGATALAVIGAFNIVGSIWIGWLSARRRMKWVLFWLYAVRALAILGYLFAPKTPMTFYVLSAVLGLTWLATVPPTAGLVGKLFGVRYLATLLGMTLLTHQIGAFFGAWLGGVAMAGTGNYLWMWYADMALAGAAALINLPIREAHPQVVAAAA